LIIWKFLTAVLTRLTAFNAPAWKDDFNSAFNTLAMPEITPSIVLSFRSFDYTICSDALASKIIVNASFRARGLSSLY
jgi:hypothetical protein